MCVIILFEAESSLHRPSVCVPIGATPARVDDRIVLLIYTVLTTAWMKSAYMLPHIQDKMRSIVCATTQRLK